MSLLCGGGGGGTAAEKTPEEAKLDQELLSLAKKEIATDAKRTKMLLLGAGESGKSTIFKQMKVINKNGYTDKEKADFIGIVHSNTFQSMTSMISAFEKLSVELGDMKATADEFMALESEKLTPDVGKLIDIMWTSPQFKEVFARRSEFQLNDSADFYFDAVERLADPKYLPDQEDILRSRVRTTGIVESEFKIKSLDFNMFDVGGQRNERRKWIHCFDNVDCVIFVASLSEFDQVLYEDETKNRLDEACELFSQIVNSKWFKETAIILFLNKKDLFEKKLKEKKFSDFVTAYSASSPNELVPCSEHIKTRMIDLNKNKEKSIFSHVTTAIDTSNVKFVFNAVVAMILERNLKASGLS